MRKLAALGASAAPAAMCGVSWSALGMSGPLMWLLAIVAGGLLGGLTWSQFSSGRGVNVGFSVLFGASAGLVAGALVGGPVGGVFGLCGGASAGLAAPLVFRALGKTHPLWGAGLSRDRGRKASGRGRGRRGRS